MNIYLILLLSFLVNFNILASANNEIFVTAERIPKKTKNITSSVKVITSKMIEQSGAHDLGELLTQFSSIMTTRNGGLGQTSSSMIQGGASEYTIIVIDGIRRDDGTRSSGGYNSGNINLSNIESIEIIKGSSSVLYGDGALSGVIKITTKKNKKSGQISLGLGGHKERSLEIEYSNIWRRFSYSLSLNLLETEGISAFNENRIKGDAEKDGFEKKFLFGSLGYHFSKFHKLILNLEFLKSKADIDSYFLDTDDEDIKFDQNNLGIIYNNRYMNGLIDSSVLYSRNEVKKKLNLRVSKNSFSSIDHALQNSNTLFHNEYHSLYWGIDLLSKSYTDEHHLEYKRTSSSLYIGNSLKFKNFFSDLGLRRDFYQDLDHQNTYKIGVGSEISNSLVLKFNMATGRKLPTLYQIHNKDFGEKDLLQTKSLNKSLTLEKMLNFGSLQVTYFDNKYKSEISYNNIEKKFFNIGKSSVQGYESSLKIKFSLLLEWEFSYTKLLARDLVNGGHLKNRPEDKFHFNQKININGRIIVNMKTRYIGKRLDYSGKTLGGYTLYDIDGTYFFTKKERNYSAPFLKISIMNIVDKEYEEIFSYGTYGRNYLLTFNLPFY